MAQNRLGQVPETVPGTTPAKNSADTRRKAEPTSRSASQPGSHVRAGLASGPLTDSVTTGLKRGRLSATARIEPHLQPRRSCKGCAYLREHPEQHALDLLDAFADPAINMILRATRGDDTYRLLPYLFERDELECALTDKASWALGPRASGRVG